MDDKWLYHPDLQGRSHDEVIQRLATSMHEIKVDAGKAGAICRWLQTNQGRWEDWPWGILISRLWEVYFGNSPMATARGAKKNAVNRVDEIFSERYGDPAFMENDASPLPYTSPVPEIDWKRTCFRFTLQAAFGMRSDCEQLARELGSHIDEHRVPDVVVVGFLGDYRRQASSSIEMAVDAREPPESGIGVSIGFDLENLTFQMQTHRAERRSPIYLISEQEWLRQALPHLNSMGITDMPF